MRTLLSFDRSGSPRRRSFDEPMISVVVPAYNHENFIVQCLTSVVDQTYDAIEIVVVDDCSTDMTFEMARDFLERHKPRFRKISLMRNAANSGAHVSLNRGIAACSGDFLSLMNSDDEYTPDRLTTIVLKMRDENAAFAFSGVATIGPDGAPYWDDPLCHHIAYRPKVALMRYPSLSWGLLWRQLTASTGNIVVTRELARKVGPFCSLRYCHDWDFVLRCAFFAEPLFVDEALYKYRVHGTNSFRALAGYAESETKSVIQSYFSRVKTARPPNRLAPAPQNWPSMFPMLAQQIGMETHLRAVYEPYLSHHRTVEATALYR